MAVTEHQFQLQRKAVRGSRNAQRTHMPLWEELIRSGETAFVAAHRYGVKEDGSAGWCFDRFGMTRTRLADGRIVCIAGEHEDYYDPDFFIYNDVIVIRPDGQIEIYGYPPDIFPPTDFHTATLIAEAIWIVGGLGYQNERGGESTPIYCLDISTWEISFVAGRGDGPGWIYGHRAEIAPDGKSIRVSGGKVIATNEAGKEVGREFSSVYVFDTATQRWSRGEGEVPTLPTNPFVAPPDWRPLTNLTKAHEARNSLVRAAAPDHPLFCEDFWPMAENADRRLALRWLDGSERWAVCDSPDYTGRQDSPSLAVTFYSSFNELSSV